MLALTSRIFRAAAPRAAAAQLAPAAASASPLAQRLMSTITVEDPPKTTVLLTAMDHPGSLRNILGHFDRRKVNMTRIESRPSERSHSYCFYVDFEGTPDDADVGALLEDLRETTEVLVLNGTKVPWFPRKISDLDKCCHRVLAAGEDLESDHPGFNDPEYRARRTELVRVANEYKIGTPIPRINYSADEIATWGAVYDKLTAVQDQFACKEFLYIRPLMEKNCGYSNANVPQQEDISTFLRECTGFRLHPVAGLLSSRDFLAGLAFRVFFSTQYIRHHSRPLYTPEPDICHELLGHAPMFADPDFADFSQQIGLASLGASDEDVMKLATCYWFSVEFGLVQERGESKAYGAGLLSSFGELEYSCAPYRPAGDTEDRPEIRDFDPFQACTQEFPITTYQPIYYQADSLEQVKERMLEFCESIKRPFYASYNPYTQRISVDRNVEIEAFSDAEVDPVWDKTE